jgi:hypothetical protein
MYVGDYFTLVTTVALDEKLRNEDEDDEDFAVRIANVLMEDYYGWNVADKANHIGVMDNSYEEDEDDIVSP